MTIYSNSVLSLLNIHLPPAILQYKDENCVINIYRFIPSASLHQFIRLYICGVVIVIIDISLLAPLGFNILDESIITATHPMFLLRMICRTIAASVNVLSAETLRILQGFLLSHEIRRFFMQPYVKVLSAIKWVYRFGIIPSDIYFYPSFDLYLTD